MRKFGTDQILDLKKFKLMSRNIYKHQFNISKLDRSIKLNQSPKLLWFTGLSGSGKSTLSSNLEKKLYENNFFTTSLDGDNLRFGLCNDLSFGKDDRIENIRRISEVSKLLLDAGLIVCASFITPLNKQRNNIKKIVGSENYIEIFVSTSLKVCEERDTKGLYKKARSGEIKNFTGISSDYEVPDNPDIIIDTYNKDIEECVNYLFHKIKNKLLLEL